MAKFSPAERAKLKQGLGIVVRKNDRQVGEYFSRPQINFGDVWCKKCQKPCEFDETCAHNAANPIRSRVYIRANCHEEIADVFMTFEQWHDNAGRRIEVFDGASLTDGERNADPLESCGEVIELDEAES